MCIKSRFFGESVQKYYCYVQKNRLFWASCRNITGQEPGAPGFSCRANFGVREEILVFRGNIHLCSSTVIGNETIVNALGEEELEDSNADKVVVKQVVLNDSPLPVANLLEVVTAVSEDFNPIESSTQAKRNMLREKGRGPRFKEDKSRNICNGAAIQRKSSDTEVESSEYDIPTFDDAPSHENICIQEKGEHDDEVRVMVKHLETRVDDLQISV